MTYLPGSHGIESSAEQQTRTEAALASSATGRRGT